MKRSLLVAVVLGTVLLGRSAETLAAPPSKKRCIAAAEAGQQLRSAGHLIEARRTLAACTPSVCPAIVRRDCGRWIEEIDAAQPSITVKLEDEGGVESPDGHVLVDGQPMPGGADGRAMLLDPGVHKLAWTRDAGNVEQEVVVREGERNRVIVLRVSPRTVARPTTDTVEVPAPPPRSPLPYVVGGLGIVLVGAGAVFWGLGLSDRSNLSATCAAAHTCAQQDIDASRTKLVVGDVLIGVGVVALAGAVFLYLKQSNDTRPRDAALLRLAPLATW